MSDHDRLLRIDEKVTSIHDSMGEFVTQDEFKPVRLIVYGLVGLIMVAVIGELIHGVLIK